MRDHPRRELRPARVNAKALFAVGNCAWLLGLVILGVLHLREHSPDGRYALVCLAGIVLGAVGYWWAHKVHLIDDEGMSE
ncbi:DUF2530 domain-containing protein [Ruania halotolerans]|uniref:DUF2530 domain-containing protein n=1 Tax=Ruania halotolerans TaxID=2897773 RepID=UPI001E4CB796|nr:DUF2530 domain-containing protein [Ruania halotolerans]UFU07284.1 DUF2530 domain-containing protein [Ruania halotolerans]